MVQPECIDSRSQDLTDVSTLVSLLGISRMLVRGSQYVRGYATISITSLAVQDDTEEDWVRAELMHHLLSIRSYSY